MSFAEIIWRMKMVAQTTGERIGYFLPKYQPPFNIGSGLAWHAKDLGNIDTATYISAADKVMDGRYDIFSMSDAMIGFPPIWNKDPKTGIKTPKSFGMAINYRNEKLVGNIKYLWEVNRHLELVTLAQAYRLTDELKYAEAVYTILSSWITQNPYPLGPNWISSLEHSIRIVNWSFTWHLVGGDASILFKGEKGKAFKMKWLRSIYEHCHFIYRHPSHYSSANNHLFGEYMGIFIGSVTWPLWKESQHWRRVSQIGLEKEAKKQNYTDGVNREQAIWYHHEVVDMMLLCGFVGKANNIAFSQDYWKKIESMIEFIASLMDVNGNLPMVGDSDDAVMIRFTPKKDFHVYRSQLATGAILFNRGDFKAKAKVFDDKTMWLSGEGGRKEFDLIQNNPGDMQIKRDFPAGGYYILGKDFETSNEVRIAIDSGPLGYLAIAAHGHADSLSLNLSVGGSEFLIDPGTFAYHTNKKWRNYFRGSSAHNTVRVDGQDQSVIAGNFMWGTKASTNCEKWRTDDNEDYFCGFHDGYTRLKDPVLHRRSVKFKKKENLIEIMDILECRGEHLIERFWHFSERCKVDKEKKTVLAENNGLHLRIEIKDKAKIKIVRADEKRPLGWVSRRFDKKAPISTALICNKISGTTILKTTMKLLFNPKSQ